MKKNGRILSLLLFAALLLFSACSGREEPPGASAAPAPVSTEAPAETAAPPEAEPPASPALPSAEEAAEAAPTEAAPPVAAGSYLYESPEYGSWTLLLKESGLFSLLHEGQTFNGEGWADNGDGSVTTGSTEAAGEAPFFDEFGSSVWTVSGSSCSPVF